MLYHASVSIKQSCQPLVGPQDSIKTHQDMVSLPKIPSGFRISDLGELRFCHFDRTRYDNLDEIGLTGDCHISLCSPPAAAQARAGMRGLAAAIGDLQAEGAPSETRSG